MVSFNGTTNSCVLTGVRPDVSRSLTMEGWFKPPAKPPAKAGHFLCSGEFGVNVFRVDVETGHSDAWRTLAPADVAGVFHPTYSLALTADGQSYCYSYGRRLSTLFVVNGLK